jgi:RimJ/RimL family protein N-acetyltransferase
VRVRHVETGAERRTGVSDHPAVLTERLEVRPAREDDRDRFVELFGDDEFMVFSGGVLSTEAAHRRFDHMLAMTAEVAFAKQPVVERASGTIVGYVGVDWFELEGRRGLELGWRLVPEARGRGYATEAGRALLDLAAETYRGEIVAIIDPRNHPSQNVARKLGFTYWKRGVVDGFLDDLYRRHVGPAG